MTDTRVKIVYLLRTEKGYPIHHKNSSLCWYENLKSAQAGVASIAKNDEGRTFFGLVEPVPVATFNRKWIDDAVRQGALISLPQVLDATRRMFTLTVTYI
jgi:hypothetical protein